MIWLSAFVRADRLARVERIFRQVFDPAGFALAGNCGKHGAEAWHISLGLPLAQWSLVADALLLLGLDPARMVQPTAGRILASPYLAGAEAEADRRTCILTKNRVYTSGYWDAVLATK